MGVFLKVVFYIIACLAALILIALAAILIKRAAVRKEQKITSDRGIYRSGNVEIGGIPQRIQIRGDDRSNPVLFMLHGGPGSSLLELSHMYQRPWESRFTVVNWDQRCTGLTGLANPDDSKIIPTLTRPTFVEDARQIAVYIKDILGDVPIIVCGQSWGTMIGTELVKAYPELFAAYIGMGQVVNSLECYQVGYDKLMEEGEKANDREMVEGLRSAWERIQNGELKYADPDFRRYFAPALNRYGFTSTVLTDNKRMMRFVFKSILSSPEISLGGFLKVYKEFARTGKAYRDVFRGDAFLGFDLWSESPEYAVPFIQINGDNDYQTPFPIARRYFDTVRAPLKKWYTLAHSGHMAQVDNLQDLTKYLFEIRDILFGTEAG